MLYVDLPGKPELALTEIIDLCCQEVVETPGDFSDDFSEDFDIGGETIVNCPTTHIFDKYVVAQTPQNTWYGVFTTTTPFPSNLKFFFFRFTFTINGQEYIYYSEQFEVENCLPLTCIKGCYPNEPAGSDAYDCNGIYYGFPSGIEPPMGESNFRYFHKACVRWGSLIEQNAKLVLGIFNNKRTYKSRLHRERLFEFEFVPAFYKNHLLGIFARGNIRIEETEYLLAEEQSWTTLDIDSKLWRLDILLTEDCNSMFGCKPADCALPIPVCENNIVRDEYNQEDDNFTQIFTGVINTGDVIEWEVYDKNESLLHSGTITQPPYQFTILGGLDLSECFKMRWRVLCQGTEPTVWKEEIFGDCAETTTIEGTFSISSSGNGDWTTGGQHCSAHGGTKFRFRFPVPLAEPLVLQFATLSYADNGSGTISYGAFGGSIVPDSNPDKQIFTDQAANGNGSLTPWSITIPAGSTDYTTDKLCRAMSGFPMVQECLISFPLCNPVWGNNRRHKFFYKVVSPVDTIVNFGVVYDTPAPFNTVPGGIQILQQII